MYSLLHAENLWYVCNNFITYIPQVIYIYILPVVNNNKLVYKVSVPLRRMLTGAVVILVMYCNIEQINKSLGYIGICLGWGYGFSR